MKLKYAHFLAMGHNQKVPRKAKRLLVGIRMSKSALNRKLKNLSLVRPCKTMYERTEFNQELFCPKCGCEHYHGTGNMTSYPEHWEYFYCLRCHYRVAWIDNSPFIHVLEVFKEG
jgi:hypothetical protein